jgi:transposase-like protein
MKKGRKTTQEERTEIVAFCIENGKDYGLTMEKYGVSYQQIYSWIRKYEAKGVEGLSDRRGKAKPEDELTEADRLRMENKILQAKIKDQEMEIKLLKKLKELRGGGH